MKYPSVPLSAQKAREFGLLCTDTLQPAGAVGVFMQLKCPLTVVHAESRGFNLDGRSMFKMSSMCWINGSQASLG